MKHILKKLSAAAAALTMVFASALPAAAATAQVRVVYCDQGGCSGVKTAIEQLCAQNGCSLSELIDKAASVCPGANCGVDNPKVPDGQKPRTGNQENTAVTPPAAETDAGYNEAYENEVIRLVNVQRAKYGLAALQRGEGACAVARVRAKEITLSFSHTRPDGRSCFTAADDTGVAYRSAGENIAYGYQTPEQVVAGWMNSEGHRKNILSSSFTKIGTGCFKSGSTLYWTQFFTG